MRRVLPALLLLVSVVAVACGGDTTAGGHDHGGHAHPHTHGSGEEGTVPGKPADPSDADRKITVVTLDELRFDPPNIEVEVGEIVTFVIQNKGKTEHEFVLGDAAYQAAHESGAHQHGSMADMESAVAVKPGETQELTWEFSEMGRVLYGCHLPGHFDGGMIGTIKVG